MEQFFSLVEEIVGVLEQKVPFFKIERRGVKINVNELIYHSAINTYKMCFFWLNRRTYFLANFDDRSKLKIVWEEYLEFLRLFSDRDKFLPIFSFLNRNVLSVIAMLLLSVIDGISHPSIREDIGVIVKGTISALVAEGEYGLAKQIMDKIERYYLKDAFFLSLLGECECQLGNRERGLSLIREAFFLEPKDVELSLLRTDVVRKVISIMEDEGIVEEEEKREWFPVYAEILGIFSERKPLSDREFAIVREDIKETFNLMQAGSMLVDNNRRNLKAEIMRKCFLLLFDRKSDSLGVREELLMIIKEIDPKIYELLFRKDTLS
jgi:hypothetical protein